MNKYNAKNYFRTLAQLPIIGAIFVVVRIELFLDKCLARFDNPISSPYRERSNDLSEKPRGPVSIGRVIELLEKEPDEYVNWFREYLEKSDSGQWAIANSPDRRSYAVMKPNREENISRIENVLLATGPKTHGKVLEVLINLLEQH